ncbi:hypothetical protein HY798_02475 [Candidatus Falkowbacteria bacterium]|nr:hypothetical protein [Candidatus Falkowbacteria bacterium]
MRHSPRKEKDVKLKAVVTEGTPARVFETMRSIRFVKSFLVEVATEILEAKDALARPAEFYVQTPDRTVNTENGFGVELRLTGVSRNGRTPKQFHIALKRLHEIARAEIAVALDDCIGGTKIQLFTVIMLDGDIETTPGSGVYSNVLEHPAEAVFCFCYFDYKLLYIRRLKPAATNFFILQF